MAVIQVDVKENAIRALDPKILRILLKDKSKEYEKKHGTAHDDIKTNIIWACDDYALLGDGYGFSDEITVASITGDKGNVIKPRTEKSKEEQSARAKEKAEVFTPSWVCNKQNNLVDNAWFERENVFNVETDNGWVTTEGKILFLNTKGKTWQDYVRANRLEISCGEAPYLASRYDTVTGMEIPVKDRIGLLDRKLRVVSENIDFEPEWVLWATKAVQSIYGYDWQGDNVLLARENILYTFAEHYEEKFSVPANKEYLIEIAKIVAWNIWQMDGIKFVIPNSCHDEIEKNYNLAGDEEEKHYPCPGCEKGDHSRHNGIYARTYDWTHNASREFYSYFVLKGAKRNG